MGGSHKSHNGLLWRRRSTLKLSEDERYHGSEIQCCEIMEKYVVTLV